MNTELKMWSQYETNVEQNPHISNMQGHRMERPSFSTH